MLSDKYDLQSCGKVTTQAKKLEGEKDKVPVFKKPRVMNEKRAENVQEQVTHTTAVQLASTLQNANILPPKKNRKKKNKEEGEVQTRIKKTKITKPGAMKSGKKAASSTKKSKQSVPEPLKPPASTQEEDLRAKEEFRDLCLERAITRRKEWTPCKDTTPDTTLLEDFDKSVDPEIRADTPLANEPLIARFGNLLGDFGFTQKEDSSAVNFKTIRQGKGEAMARKRKIEFVNGVTAPRVSEKPKRSRSPKKKPQTITEKATAPFAPAKSMAAPSLLQYFGAPATETMDHGKGATENLDTSVTVGPKPPSKKSAASKPKTSKAKKPVQKQPVLLSPEAAMKSASDQELMFGTSSQLAREDSPTFIKDLQQAMKESESTMEQKQTLAEDYEFLDLPSGRSRLSNVRAIMASKSLWSAASRDTDGALIEVETVNLADTPKPIPAVTERTYAPKMPALLKPQLKAEDSIPPNTGETVSIAPKLKSDDVADLQQQLEESDSLMPRSVAEAALRNRPKNKSPGKKTAVTKSTTNQMPNYEGFTDVQLRKEVASYRFKPIKKREAMIMLLEQCWKSKMSMALQEVPGNLSLPQHVVENNNTEASMQKSPPKKRGRPPKTSDLAAATADNAPPNKPRGRSKKDPTVTTPRKRKRKSKAALSEALVSAADDEIYDSSPPTPSPLRRRSPPKSPGQLELSQPLENSGTNATTTLKDRSRAFLLAQITKAVTTFPPTHDVKNLTWYEKMLMYDPIVLEDLSAWLNTEGLGSVGEDDEVWPGLVKEWCEERSVCCLWKENLRGGAKDRW